MEYIKNLIKQVVEESLSKDPPYQLFFKEKNEPRLIACRNLDKLIQYAEDRNLNDYQIFKSFEAYHHDMDNKDLILQKINGNIEYLNNQLHGVT